MTAAAGVPEPDLPIVPRDQPQAVAPTLVARLLEAVTAGDDQGVLDAVRDAAGLPRSAYGRQAAKPQVRIYPWVCPYCDGGGRVDGEQCLECAGFGLTDDPGDGTVARRPAPTPPAVMKRPCSDCAMRPGSPEEDTPPPLDTPFFCHHGMHRIGDGYESPAYVGGLPLGAMVCRGWWDAVTTGMTPTRPFRDPGGANRADDAPGAH